MGDTGQTVGVPESNCTSVDFNQPLVAKRSKEAYDGFDGHSGHLGHFFALESDSDLDTTVSLLPKPSAQLNEDPGEPFPRGLKGELVELIHMHPHLAAQELDDLECQLRIAPNESKIRLPFNEADLGRLQRLAGGFVNGPLVERVLFDHIAGVQDTHDLPLPTDRGPSEFHLPRTQQVEAKTSMPLVKHNLVRLVMERAFDLLEPGKVVAGHVAQDRLGSQPACLTTFYEQGLSLHWQNRKHGVKSKRVLNA